MAGLYQPALRTVRTLAGSARYSYRAGPISTYRLERRYPVEHRASDYSQYLRYGICLAGTSPLQLR